MRRFFITGLPRSRTAWLANLFTTSEVLCRHDALLECDRVADLPRVLGRRAIAGDADSALLLFHDEVAALFPHAPWVVIERDPEEALRSLVAKYGSDLSNGGWPLLTVAMQSIPRDDETILRVPYEELDDVALIRKIWNHCVPMVPFNEPRWAVLRDLKVERIPPEVSPARRRALAAALFEKGTVSG